MSRDDVIAVLRFFRYIDSLVIFNENEIKKLDSEYYYVFVSQRMDGLPGAKGGTSNPTEIAALNIPSSFREEIAELQKENSRLTKLKTAILREINTLSYLQRRVVFEFYINDSKWQRISAQMDYSVRQCKNIRDKALDRLSKRFEQNKIIATYGFPEQ